MSDPNNPTDYPNANTGSVMGWPTARERARKSIVGYGGLTPDGDGDDGARILYAPYSAGGGYSPYISIGHFRQVIDSYGPGVDGDGNPIPNYRREVDPRFASLLPYAFGYQGRAVGFDTSQDETIILALPNIIGASASGTINLTDPGYYQSEAQMRSGVYGASSYETEGGTYHGTTSQGSNEIGYVGDAPGGFSGGYSSGTVVFDYAEGSISFDASVTSVGTGGFVTLVFNVGSAGFNSPHVDFLATPKPGTRGAYNLDASPSTGTYVQGGIPVTTYEHKIASYDWTFSDSTGVLGTSTGLKTSFEYKGSDATFDVALQIRLAVTDQTLGTTRPLVAGPAGRTILTVTPSSFTGPTRVTADTRTSVPPTDTSNLAIPLKKVSYDWGDGTKTTEEFGVVAYHDYASAGDYTVTARASTATHDPVAPDSKPLNGAMSCLVSGVLHITHTDPNATAPITRQFTQPSTGLDGGSMAANITYHPSVGSSTSTPYQLTMDSGGELKITMNFLGGTDGVATHFGIGVLADNAADVANAQTEFFPGLAVQGLVAGPTLHDVNGVITLPLSSFSAFLDETNSHGGAGYLKFVCYRDGGNVAAMRVLVLFNSGSGSSSAPSLRVTWPADQQPGDLAGGVAILQPGDVFDAKLKLNKLKPKDFHYELLLDSAQVNTITQTVTVPINRHAVGVLGGGGDLTTFYKAELGVVPPDAVVSSLEMVIYWHRTDGQPGASTLQVAIAPHGVTPLPDGTGFLPGTYTGTRTPADVPSVVTITPDVTTVADALTREAYDLYFSVGSTMHHEGIDVTISSVTVTRVYTVTRNSYLAEDDTHADVVGGPEHETISWFTGARPHLERTQELTPKWCLTAESWFCSFGQVNPYTGDQAADAPDTDRDPLHFVGNTLAHAYVIKSRRGGLQVHTGAPPTGFSGNDLSGHPLVDEQRLRGDGALLQIPNKVIAFNPSGGTLVEYDSHLIPPPQFAGGDFSDDSIISYSPLDVPVEEVNYPYPGMTGGLVAHWRCYGVTKYFAFDGPAIEDPDAIDDLNLTYLEILATSSVNDISVFSGQGVIGSGGTGLTGQYQRFLYDLLSPFSAPYENQDDPSQPVSALGKRDDTLYVRTGDFLPTLRSPYHLLRKEIVSYPDGDGARARQFPVTGIQARRVYTVNGPRDTAPLTITTVDFTCDKVAPDDPVGPYIPNYLLAGTPDHDYIEFTRMT